MNPRTHKSARRQQNENRGWCMLTVHDSPTENTGFANVMKPLLRGWQNSGKFRRIDIWGLNFLGWPHDLPWRIYPGGIQGWCSVANFRQLLELIQNGDYTHVFLLHDPWALSAHEFAPALRKQCDDSNVKLIVYFPVDGSLQANSLPIIQAADVVITYTAYGVAVLAGFGEALKGKMIHVIPHGVDTNVFKPLPGPFAVSIGGGKFKVDPSDFFLLNVNRLEKRKALVNSLQILALLIRDGVPAKLMLHAPRRNKQEDIDLEIIGAQLGLEFQNHWTHHDAAMLGGIGLISESDLNQLYNAASLTITTSLGEGWGLSITEAAAAGCPVAVPDHTSCAEIAAQFAALGDDRVFTLPLSNTAITNPLDGSRIRFPVDVTKAAMHISERYRSGWFKRQREALSPAIKEWLSWDRITNEFLKLF